jgi:hypothetical protein
MPADLTIARRAYDQHDWPAAYEGLRTAETGPDLERLAVAAQLIGLEEESVDAYRRAHTVFLKEHEVERAVRCAAQLVMSFISRGDMAQAQGWLARGRRILDDSGSDCVEAGYLNRRTPHAARSPTTSAPDARSISPGCRSHNCR